MSVHACVAHLSSSFASFWGFLLLLSLPLFRLLSSLLIFFWSFFCFYSYCCYCCFSYCFTLLLFFSFDLFVDCTRLPPRLSSLTSAAALSSPPSLPPSLPPTSRKECHNKISEAIRTNPNQPAQPKRRDPTHIRNNIPRLRISTSQSMSDRLSRN